MTLVTVTNEKFAASTFNLINSYKAFSFDEYVLVYDFGLKKETANLLRETYKDQVYVNSVDKVCDHSHEPRTFFYKAFAIKNGFNDSTKDIIYSDATNAFVKESKDLYQDTVNSGGRLLLPYTAEKLSNKYWCTEKSFKKMHCDKEDYYNSPQYWAGFQCYQHTQENKEFVDTMYDYMMDIELAGPDTTVKRPDGYDAPCIEHRQDQSVLSLLIERWGWRQRYDEEINNKYGDLSTFADWEEGFSYDEDKVVLSARFSKFGNYRFVAPELLGKI
jgi:hypothetical protein